jgi:hypothetical protein
MFLLTVGVTLMRLVEQQRELRHRIREIIPHYDRIELRFDSNDEIFNCKEWSQIQEHCHQASWHIIEKRKFSHRWKKKLTLLQPTTECLKLIKSILAGKYYACLVSYVEVTLDWITDTREDAQYIHDFLNVSVVKRSGKKQYYYHQYSKVQKLSQDGKPFRTTYFAPANSNVVFVIYSDRGSKMREGKPCAHFELRLKGAETCSRYGLYTLNELIDKSILTLFRKMVHLFPQPTKLDIGRFLANQNKPTDMTPQGYIKVCDRFLKECGMAKFKTLTLQRLLMENPSLYKLLGQHKKAVFDFRQAIKKSLFDA